MPYLNDQDAEDLKKQQEQSGNPQAIAGQSSVLSGSSAQAGQPKESGSYTNLNQYLDANKTQAASMGAKIATDINQNATTAIDKTNQFKAAAPQVQSFDPSNIYNNITTLSDSDKQAYQTAKKGYQGPQSASEVEGYGDLQKSVSKADTQVKNAASETGRQSLLQEAYARPQYSQGQQKLDQMLLQNSADSKKGFEDVTQNFSGIMGMFDQANQDVGGRINQNIQTGYQNQQAINVGDAKAKSDLMNPIQARATQANIENPKLAQRVKDHASDEILSQETLDLLGLTEGQNVYDMDLSAYLRPDLTQVGLDNVATADERAKYAALTALLDGQAGQDITAGGKSINPVGFDKTKYTADQLAKDTEYKAAYADQRGTSLNLGYLPNPNAANGYAAYIPGQYTDRRDLNNASPSELENYWLPIFQRAQAETGYNIYGQTAEAIQKSVADWKANYNPTRTIKKG